MFPNSFPRGCLGLFNITLLLKVSLFSTEHFLSLSSDEPSVSDMFTQQCVHVIVFSVEYSDWKRLSQSLCVSYLIGGCIRISLMPFRSTHGISGKLHQCLTNIKEDVEMGNGFPQRISLVLHYRDGMSIWSVDIPVVRGTLLNSAMLATLSELYGRPACYFPEREGGDGPRSPPKHRVNHSEASLCSWSSHLRI